MNDHDLKPLHEELERLLGGPITIPTEMPFGKFRGMAFDRIPRGYLRWLLSTGSLAPGLREAVEAVVEKK